MSSPFTRGTLYLKRRNQDLLAQLESNSAILQDRLGRLSKALTQSTREHPHSTPLGSPLKRKRGYESWLARNDSGQVSASLNPNTFWGSTPSPVVDPDDVPMTSRRVDASTAAMSPTKRAKKCGDQCPHHDKTTGGKRAKSKPRKAQCPDCYCQSSKQQAAPKEHGKKNAGRVCVGCTDYKIPDNSAASLGGSQRRTLEEARSLLRYSPESKFLKRLKERSKVDLDGTETSSPESTVNDNREGSRERRRQPAKAPTTAYKPRSNARSINAIESSRPTLKTLNTNVRSIDTSNGSRPTLKTPSNITNRSDRSVRRDITESTSKTSKRHDQPARDIPRPVANPYKPTTAPPRNIPPKNTVPRTFKTTYDLPKSTRPTTTNPLPSTLPPSKHPGRSPNRKICRPALSKLTPLPSNNLPSPPPPRVTNNSPPATRSKLHRDLSPPRATNTRPQSKTPKHVVSAKDRVRTNNKSKVARGKSRATSSRGVTSSSKKDSRTSPTASSSGSPSSSPTRGDSKAQPKRSTERTCPVETRENCRPPTKKSPSLRPKRSKSKGLHAVPSCYNAGDNLKTSPVGYSPGTKYRKKVYRPYCKKYRRKESCTTTTEGNEIEERRCCLDAGSPTVERCKSYGRRHRKAQGGGASCCSHCCCAGKPRTARPCECVDPERDDWVDEIGRFRRSHWFDCHSYPDVRERPASGRDKHRHEGFHRFILNDRLFPTPLPCATSCARCRHAREVTVDAPRRNRDVLPVVLPQASRAEELGRDAFRVYHEGRATGGHKTHECMLTHPIYSKPPLHRFAAPAQSLALRYQKGIV